VVARATVRTQDTLAFDGRTALIAGASKGIGRACAAELVAGGARVVSLSRSGGAAPGTTPVRCDLTDPVATAAAVRFARDRIGPIEILVVSAGGATTAPALLASDSHISDEIDANLKAVFRIVRLVGRDMWRSSFGRIVLLGSIAGEVGCAGASVYAAAKAGLEGFAKSLAVELAPKHITVNVVAPGLIRTELLAQEPTIEGAASSSVPLRRLGTPEEVAKLIGFLVSDDAAYITGAVIPIDGAMRLRSIADGQG
jgi:3-oxoacyl-[acyl-carrier protein] reductase